MVSSLNVDMWMLESIRNVWSLLPHWFRKIYLIGGVNFSKTKVGPVNEFVWSEHDVIENNTMFLVKSLSSSRTQKW